MEHLSGLTILLRVQLFCLAADLIVDFNLILGHLDIIFNDTDLLLLFRTLKAEIHAILLGLLNHFWRGLPRWLLGLFNFLGKLVKLRVCLKVDFVLLIELDFKAYDVCDIAQDARI